MPLSRLRLRLTVWFAVAFLGGLALLDLSLYGYLRHQADRRLTRQVRANAGELIRFVRAEFEENPPDGVAAAGREALREWPAPPGGYVILSPTGEHLAEQGPAEWLTLVGTTTPIDGSLVDEPVGREHPVRRLVLRVAGVPEFAVAVLQSTDRTAEENEALAWWLGLSLPIVLLFALGGGYVLSRRALAPVVRLEHEIATITPHRLDYRVPVAAPPDELDRVAERFNGLLDRLEESGNQNRQFLRQAAHQIRTPLTLVVGETSLALREAEGPATGPFRRIQRAAEQIQRRVEELFLLAEARSGQAPLVVDQVEADALVLECAEMMRGRAQLLGHQLLLRDVSPVVFPGNNGLIREALLELVENALRHGVPAPDTPVTLSARTANGHVRLDVESTGTPITTPLEVDTPWTASGERGLGLAVVRWIAEQHGGRLEHTATNGSNVFSLVLPVAGRQEG